jgi:hypothetical protein
VTVKQETALNAVNSWSILLGCRMVCGHSSKRQSLSLSLSLSLCFSLFKRESETESKKEADRKRRVFVSLTFILSGEWI